MRQRLFANKIIFIGIVLCGLITTPTIWAKGFVAISPLISTLSAQKRVDIINVFNRGNKAITYQVQLMRWRQEFQKDVYEKSRDILVTPPIFTVAPGKKQIIRLGLRLQPDPKVERAYRLVLKQVTSLSAPIEPISMDELKPRVQFILGLNLPVFVLPRQPISARLVWTVKRASGNMLALQARNIGRGHAKITNIRLSSGRQKTPLVTPVALTYILPQQLHVWVMTASQGLASSQVTVNAKVNGNEVQKTLAIAR